MIRRRLSVCLSSFVTGVVLCSIYIDFCELDTLYDLRKISRGVDYNAKWITSRHPILVSVSFFSS